MACTSKHRVRLKCLHYKDKFVAELDLSHRYPKNVTGFIIEARGVTDATESVSMY